jgi:hypothetical protein
LSFSYSLCILLRFTELIFGLEILQLSRMGTRRYVLSVDNDNEFRSRCE